MKDEHDRFTIDFNNENDTGVVLKLLSKLINNKLNRTDFIVLQHIIHTPSDFNRKASFCLNKTNIATALQMQQPNVSVAVKRLVESGILVQLSQDEYRLEL